MNHVYQSLCQPLRKQQGPSTSTSIASITTVLWQTKSNTRSAHDNFKINRTSHMVKTRVQYINDRQVTPISKRGEFPVSWKSYTSALGVKRSVSMCVMTLTSYACVYRDSQAMSSTKTDSFHFFQDVMSF